MGKKAKEAANQNTLTTDFDIKARRKEKKKPPEGTNFTTFFGGTGLGAWALGLVVFDPSGLIMASSLFATGVLLKTGNTLRNRDTFKIKSQEWLTESYQNVKGTPFQREVYKEAQREIFRLQAEIDQSPNLERRKKAQTLIQQITEAAQNELSDVEILYDYHDPGSKAIRFVLYDEDIGPKKRRPLSV